MKGSIKWVAVVDALPVPESQTRHTSLVLLHMQNGIYAITRGVYIGANFVGWEYSDYPYEPTHWAYINPPEL